MWGSLRLAPTNYLDYFTVNMMAKFALARRQLCVPSSFFPHPHKSLGTRLLMVVTYWSPSRMYKQQLFLIT